MSTQKGGSTAGTLNVAILGYGRSGSTMHAGAVEHNPDMRMAAVCDTDETRRAQATQRFGCPVYEDYHEMLRSEKLDLVCVITRSDQHAAMSCDCLEVGVPVLVTKPWAVNAQEAQRMVETHERTGTPLLPWLPARWGCDLRRIRELVGRGEIGEVFLIRRIVSSFGTRNDWQTERRYGGGYLLNWGAHIIDPPVVLADSPVRSVYGKMRQINNPGDAEDVFIAVMTLENGTVVDAEYTIAVDHLPDWFVQGSRGTIITHGNRLTVHRVELAAPDDPTKYAAMTSEGSSVREEELEGALYGDEHEIYREIVQALRGERTFPVSPRDALRLSEVFDAVRLSSEENRTVRLPEATT